MKHTIIAALAATALAAATPAALAEPKGGPGGNPQAMHEHGVPAGQGQMMRDQVRAQDQDCDEECEKARRMKEEQERIREQAEDAQEQQEEARERTEEQVRERAEGSQDAMQKQQEKHTERTEAGKGSEQGQAMREEHSRKWWKFWE
jgi:hypothetical protein